METPQETVDRLVREKSEAESRGVQGEKLMQYTLAIERARLRAAGLSREADYREYKESVEQKRQNIFQRARFKATPQGIAEENRMRASAGKPPLSRDEIFERQVVARIRPPPKNVEVTVTEDIGVGEGISGEVGKNQMEEYVPQRKEDKFVFRTVPSSEIEARIPEIGFEGSDSPAMTFGKSIATGAISGLATTPFIAESFVRKPIETAKQVPIGIFETGKRFGQFARATYIEKRNLNPSEIREGGIIVGNVAGQIALGKGVSKIVGSKPVTKGIERFEEKVPIPRGEKISFPSEDLIGNPTQKSIIVGGVYTTGGQGRTLVKITDQGIGFGKVKESDIPKIRPEGRGFEPVSSPVSTRIFEESGGLRGGGLPKTESENIQLGIETRRLVGGGTNTLLSKKFRSDLSRTLTEQEQTALFETLKPYRGKIIVKGSAPQQSQVLQEGDLSGYNFVREFGDIDFDVFGGKDLPGKLATKGAEAMSKSGGRKFVAEGKDIYLEGGDKVVQFLPKLEDITQKEFKELGLSSKPSGKYEGFAGYRYEGTQKIPGIPVKATTRTGQIGRKMASTFTIQGESSREFFGGKGKGLTVGPPGYPSGGRTKDVADTIRLLKTEASELIKNPRTRERGVQLNIKSEQIMKSFPELDFQKEFAKPFKMEIPLSSFYSESAEGRTFIPKIITEKREASRGSYLRETSRISRGSFLSSGSKGRASIGSFGRSLSSKSSIGSKPRLSLPSFGSNFSIPSIRSPPYSPPSSPPIRSPPYSPPGKSPPYSPPSKPPRYPPYYPPSRPPGTTINSPPFIPKIGDFGGSRRKSFGSLNFGKPPSKYTPTLIGLFSGRTTKSTRGPLYRFGGSGKAASFTGIEVRYPTRSRYPMGRVPSLYKTTRKNAFSGILKSDRTISKSFLPKMKRISNPIKRRKSRKSNDFGFPNFSLGRELI